MVGPDRDLFLKGRSAENRGLGIGAFAYYRRVVEEQKGRILDEMIRVAERTGAPAEMIQTLGKAKEETQFARALEVVKDGIPATLLIDGHNPLRLLHRALSAGVHELTDEECLELASSVRVVLTEFSEKVAQVLKDQAELKTAVAKLAVGAKK